MQIVLMELSSFLQEKIELVDPELDRFVLIHKLGNDARALANKTEPDGKTPKKDVEKATEADQLASEFCEAEVCEGTFFETEIEYKTVALSKSEIEARPRRGFFPHSLVISRKKRGIPQIFHLFQDQYQG